MIPFTVAAVFLGAHAAAAAAGGTWWGLHFLRYLVPGSIAGIAVGAVAAGGAVAWPGAWRSRLPSAAREVVLVAVFLLAAWTLRDRSHLLGDGTVILDPANAVVTFSAREPGAHLLDVALQRAAVRFGRAPATVFGAWSVLCGLALLGLVRRADRLAGTGGWLTALALTTGAMQLFFGYAEHYPAIAVLWVACLVVATPALTRPALLLPALLAFVAALFLHVGSVVLVPMLAWATWRQIRLRSGAARAWPVAEAVVAAAIAGITWSLAFRGVPNAPSLTGYLGILRETGRFVDGAADASAVAPRLLSAARAMDVLHLQLLLVPIVLPLAIVGVVRILRSRRLSAIETGWGIAAVSLFGAQALFSPSLGAPRDWDVLAAGAFPLAFLAASLTRDAFAPRTRGVLVALATFHALAWIAVNACPVAAAARFAELPLSAGQVDFVLGTQALKRGAFGEAISRFGQVVHDVPDTCPGWFSLGLAHEGAGHADAARDAFARALLLYRTDRRVPEGEILERLGRAAWSLGRVEEAREAFTRAHTLRPGSLPPVVFLAVLASREGRPDDVLRLLDPFLPRRADQPSILMLTADALDSLGRGREAAERRAEAARLFPDDPNVRAATSRRPAETTP